MARTSMEEIWCCGTAVTCLTKLLVEVMNGTTPAPISSHLVTGIDLQCKIASLIKCICGNPDLPMKTEGISALTVLGLAIWHGHPAAGVNARRHDEIELALVEC